MKVILKNKKEHGSNYFRAQKDYLAFLKADIRYEYLTFVEYLRVLRADLCGPKQEILIGIPPLYGCYL